MLSSLSCLCWWLGARRGSGGRSCSSWCCLGLECEESVAGTVCVEAAADAELAFGSRLRSEVENSIATATATVTVTVTVTATGLRLVDEKPVWRRGCGGQSL